MKARVQKITPFLWFDTQAEEAVEFYTSIFKSSKVIEVTRYGKEGAEASGRPEGTVMTISFQLEGVDFVALNGGPSFRFNEAVSFVVNCDSQEEIDYYWEALSRGGDEKAQQCGWLKDRFGVSWQIAPSEWDSLLCSADPDKAGRVMKALLQMKKLDLDALRRA